MRDGWLIAEKTTLGADNGIGVALMLAALEDTHLLHGPLEALFTVDEEAGMGGARGLAAGALQGQLMLNLDTEEWGEFYLGCAGGLDVNVQRDGVPATMPADHQVFRIEMSGLRGGQRNQVAGSCLAGIELGDAVTASRAAGRFGAQCLAA